jgi:putative hydrolase of the HAD superfamily
MKYKAVIFDLFGTLVDSISRQGYERMLSEMAVILNAPPVEFRRLWLEIFENQFAGVTTPIETNIKHVCQALGLSNEAERISSAVELRTQFKKRSFIPREDAFETLSHLKMFSFKTGLISDCTPPTPEIWRNSSIASLIDVAIFSCVVGLTKPNPAIYRLTYERLVLSPKECLYIGDGSNHELSGALRVGMHPVLFRHSYEDTYDPFRADVSTWNGPAISSLKDVLALVE